VSVFRKSFDREWYSSRLQLFSRFKYKLEKSILTLSLLLYLVPATLFFHLFIEKSSNFWIAVESLWGLPNHFANSSLGNRLSESFQFLNSSFYFIHHLLLPSLQMERPIRFSTLL